MNLAMANSILRVKWTILRLNGKNYKASLIILINPILMNIRQIIENHYDELKKRVEEHNDNSIFMEPGDILHNQLIRAINMYDDTDISEDEGLAYIKRDLYMESVFIPKREHNIVFVDIDDVKDQI